MGDFYSCVDSVTKFAYWYSLQFVFGKWSVILFQAKTKKLYNLNGIRKTVTIYMRKSKNTEIYGMRIRILYIFFS